VRVKGPNCASITSSPAEASSLKYIDNAIVRSLTGSEPTARELDIAILVARSMICELQAAGRDWEVALKELGILKSELGTTNAN
jgi:hypothetical protein